MNKELVIEEGLLCLEAASESSYSPADRVETGIEGGKLQPLAQI